MSIVKINGSACLSHPERTSLHLNCNHPHARACVRSTGSYRGNNGYFRWRLTENNGESWTRAQLNYVSLGLLRFKR